MTEHCTMHGFVYTAIFAVLLVSGSRECNRVPTKIWEDENHEVPSICGSSNPNKNVIDDSESGRPGPFHDLTTQELRKLRNFLENDPNIRAQKSSKATLNSSYIFTAELMLPRKADVLQYLDSNGRQPDREARVVMFRGDKTPAVVEEYVCGPLPDVAACQLMNLTTYRNPVEFSVRPLSGLEGRVFADVILKEIDKKVGHILKESYGETFTNCVRKENCLKATVSPVGTGILGDMNKRLMWVNALYDTCYTPIHYIDFSVLVDFNGPDPAKWRTEKVWYSNQLFQSLEDLSAQYSKGIIEKTVISKPVVLKPANDENLSLKRRGDDLQPKPQRPPRLVEPDGKRYSVREKQVEYLGWSFSYRLSALNGPSVYNIRYKGEKIVYEIGLAEMATLFSGFSPFQQTSDFINSGFMMGSRSKALVLGADCPDTATLLSATFMSQYSEEPAVYEAAMCLFENNNGDPLRRHLSYETANGGFYNGMLDSALTLRSILTTGNFDYVVDYIFHQDGAIHTKVLLTGILLPTFFTPPEKPYGHQIHEHSIAGIHSHLINFKVDLDVGGTSNRYETLDVEQERISLTAFPDKPYSQIRFNSSLKRTEQETKSDYKFSSSEYHLVHNNARKNKYNDVNAYRIKVDDLFSNMFDVDYRKSVPWASNRMVVTKRKDNEMSSSSMYSLFDSHSPVVNFTSFYADDENIVDEDLVFWITSVKNHIPHTEDVPVVPDMANPMGFYLLPHNYFPENPSMASRDAVSIELKDPKDPTKGVIIERNGNSVGECVLPKLTLEEDLEGNPDRILESRRTNPTDF